MTLAIVGHRIFRRDWTGGVGISTSLCHSQGSWYLQKSPSDPPIPQSCPENLSCNLKGENDSWKGLQFSQTSDGLLAGGAEGPLMADASREEDDDDQGDVGLGKKGFSSAQVFGHSWRPASTTWMWVSKCRTDGGKKYLLRLTKYGGYGTLSGSSPVQRSPLC